MNEQIANDLFQRSVALLQQGQAKEALKLLRKLDQAVPSNPGILYFTATGLSISGEKQKAIQTYERVLRLNPQFIEAYNNIALDLAYLGDHQRAISYFEKALAIKSDFIECLLNKGCTLNELGRHSEAVACFKSVIDSGRMHPDALANLCISYIKLGDLAKAKETALTSLSLNENDHRVYQNLGSISLGEEQPEEAISFFKKALSIRPKDVDALNGIGYAHIELDNYTEAASFFNEALEINPEYETTYANLGRLHHNLRDFENAVRFFSKPLKSKKRSADREYDKALSNLHAKQLSEGWVDYNWRWTKILRPSPYLQTTRPLWNGESTTDKVLIWSEQGIGDQILFASLLPEAIKLTRNLLVRLDKRLLPLFQRSFPNVSFIAHDLQLTDDDFQFHLPIGDLARLLRTSLENFDRQPAHYLQPDIDRVRKLRDTFERGKLVLGLAWRTSGERSKARNLPIKEIVSVIYKIVPAVFVDLQYSDTTEDRSRISQELGVEIRHLGEIDNFNDLDGLASLISACDFLITCSNSTAHLAGALGKETYLLVPFSRGRHWYWSHIGADGRSLWYPSVHVIPQSVAGDWAGPIQALKDRLSCRPILG